MYLDSKATVHPFIVTKMTVTENRTVDEYKQAAVIQDRKLYDESFCLLRVQQCDRPAILRTTH